MKSNGVFFVLPFDTRGVVSRNMNDTAKGLTGKPRVRSAMRVRQTYVRYEECQAGSQN